MLHTAAAEAAELNPSSGQGSGGGCGPSLRRLGSPDEIANVVTFVVSEEASYVSGVYLPVDGAMMA